MGKKGLYLAVGFLWATLLGIGAGIAAAVITAGVAWIYLFGDSTWPEWTNWAIPGFGFVVGLATFAVTMMVSRMVANRYDGRANEKQAGKGGALAWTLLFLGLAVAGGFAWQQYGRHEEIEKAREGAAAAARYFPMLLSETHRISDIAVTWPGGGQDGRAAVTLDGLREGGYRFEWQVRDTLYEKPLISGTRDLNLTTGVKEIEIVLSAHDVVAGYRTLLNRQDANIMVDEPFVFEAQLAPIPTEYETSRMPPHEVRNLANGWSPLIHSLSAEFPVRFFLHGETLSWN